MYWEERWEQDVEEMRREFGIWAPPEVRWGRPLKEAAEAGEVGNQRNQPPSASGNVNASA